jgi:hypothetical protein
MVSEVADQNPKFYAKSLTRLVLILEMLGEGLIVPR